jgi:hypothetical protein
VWNFNEYNQVPTCSRNNALKSTCRGIPAIKRIESHHMTFTCSVTIVTENMQKKKEIKRYFLHPKINQPFIVKISSQTA